MWFALQRAVEKIPDCSIYTEVPMTIFDFAGKHVKIIHHPPPHCDLSIFNGDDSPAPKLKKVKNCPTCCTDADTLQIKHAFKNLTILL